MSHGRTRSGRGRASAVGRWHALVAGSLLTASLAGCAPALESDAPSASRGALARAALILPIYGDRGVAGVMGPLRPFVDERTTLMVVSGNEDPHFDPDWVAVTLEVLAREFPRSRLVIATSGEEHVRRALDGAAPLARAVVYIYEPNVSNEPGFSWEFDAARASLARARARADLLGVALHGKPTGRPLLEPSLQRHAWDYGELARGLDELYVQTQTYCRQGAGAFADALGRLALQVRRVSPTPRVHVQVSVGSAFPNGVDPVRAGSCLDALEAHVDAGTFAGVLVWWSPEQTRVALEVLQRLRAAAPPGAWAPP